MNVFVIYLAVNSKEYAVYNNGERIFYANYCYDYNDLVAFINDSKIIITEAEFKNSCKLTIDKLKINNINIEDIFISGIRVSLPGNFFTSTKIIDENYIKQIKHIANYLSDINTTNLLYEINQLKKLFPNTPIIGVSDTEFHTTMPAISSQYAIKNSPIHKYGSHGIIIKSVINYLKSITFNKKLYENVIICNIDDNSSISAIKNGKSLDTSTGFTEFDGLPGMQTSGNIDISAMTFLMKKEKLSLDEFNDYLTKNGGLQSFNNEISLKLLLYLYRENNNAAKYALEYLVYNIKKYIGAYIVSLGKLDTLIFTGNYGYKYPIIREMICNNLDILGIHLDIEDNNNPEYNDGFIQNQASKTKIIVINQDPLKEIYYEVNKFSH